MSGSGSDFVAVENDVRFTLTTRQRWAVASRQLCVSSRHRASCGQVGTRSSFNRHPPGAPPMTSDDLCFLDLVEVGRRVQAGKLSSVEVTKAVLERIARLDGRLKSYATLTADLALAQANQADTEIARGAIRGPLHGVPIAVKDLCH